MAANKQFVYLIT